MTDRTQPAAQKRTITIERTYAASLEDVWALWTTKEGIESWWGPDGFSVKVRKLDLRPGGTLEYAMIATGAPQIEFMKRAGMPVTVEHQATYREIVPLRRLEYEMPVDFILGVEPYPVTTVVVLHPAGQGVRMVLTIDAMHDEEWTRRAVMGWESELGKLARALEARGRAYRG